MALIFPDQKKTYTPPRIQLSKLFEKEEREIFPFEMKETTKTTTPKLILPERKLTKEKTMEFPLTPIGEVWMKTLPEAPGTYVKVPFMQKEFSVPQNMIGEITKWGVELPEKVTVSLQELPYIIKNKKVPEYEAKAYRIPSYAEDTELTIANLKKLGYSDKEAITIGILQNASSAIWDVAIVSDLIRLGAIHLSKGITPALEEKIAAWKLLGRPKTMGELKVYYRKLAHQFHPDIVGEASAPAMKEITNAYNILEKGGLPTKADFIKLQIGKYTFPIIEPDTAIFVKTPEGIKLAPAQAIISPSPGLKTFGRELVYPRPLPFKQLPGLVPVEPEPFGLRGLEIKKMKPVGGKPEILKKVRRKVYYRGIKPGVKPNAIKSGYYFTSKMAEARIYGARLISAKIKLVNPLYSENLEDSAKQLGIWNEKFEELLAKDPIAADNLIFREAKKQGYDAIVREEGDWVIPLKEEIIKPVERPKRISRKEQIIEEEAEMLRDLEAGRKVAVIRKEEGYTALSEHSPAYQAFYREYGRSPRSLNDWKKIAERELEAGRSALGLAKEYQKLIQKAGVEKEIDVAELFKTDENLGRLAEKALITEQEKKEFLKSLSDEIVKKLRRSRPLTAAETRAVARAFDEFLKTGGRMERIITKPEREILRLKLRAEERGARMGKKEAKAEIKEKEEVKRVGSKIEELAKKINRIDISNLPLEQKSQIQAILENFDLKFRSGKTLAKREALRNYVERLRQEGQPIEDIPEHVLEAAESIPLNELTLEQMQMLHDEIMRLVHLGRLKNRLIKIQGQRKVQQMVDEIKKHLAKIKQPPPPKVITGEAVSESWYQKRMEQTKGFLNRTFRVERILMKLDEYIEGGKMQTIFYEPVNKAKDEKLKGIMRMQDQFIDLVKRNKIDLGKILTDKIELAKDVVITPSERIGIYLHSLNPDNLMHLKYGNNFSDELIQKAIEGMTNDEKTIAEFLQKYFTEEGPAISKIRTLIEGKSLGITENYFPIRLQWKADPIINFEQELTKEESQRFAAKWASSRIAKGFLKERSHKAMQPVDLDALSIFWDHLEKVEHYKAFAPVVRDLQLILKNPEVRTAVQSAGGREVYKVLDQWLKQVAETNPYRPLSSGDAAIRTMRVNAVTAVLGINLTTAVKQFASFFNGIAEIGELPALKGLLEAMVHNKEIMQLMKEYSPQIYKRSFEREVAEAKVIKELEKRMLNKLSKREIFMILTTTIDRITVNAIWKGAFDDYLKRNPGELKRAAEYAERAIRRTQPFFDIKDLAEYWRSGEFMKTLTMFTNQLNQNWNYYWHDIWGKFSKKRIPFTEVVRKTIEAFVIPALIIAWASNSRPSKNVKEFVRDEIAQALAVIPILGSWLASGYKGFRGQGVVSTELLSTAQEIGYRISKSQWEKVAMTTPELVGYAYGLPVVQPKRIVETIVDMASGETDDWLRLIWGKYTREKAKTEKAESTIPSLEVPAVEIPTINLPSITY